MNGPLVGTSLGPFGGEETEPRLLGTWESTKTRRPEVGRSDENTGFVCESCGRLVKPATNGSYRNHCPFCLYSKHLDVLPGDRSSECQGLMEPTELAGSRKGLQIVHRCLRCGVVRVNRVAELTDQPDDVEAIVPLMQHRMRSN